MKHYCHLGMVTANKKTLQNISKAMTATPEMIGDNKGAGCRGKVESILLKGEVVGFKTMVWNWKSDNYYLNCVSFGLLIE